jgi:Pyridoxamine 5'-phosphate oxidase
VARWGEFAAEAPELAARARGFLEAHKHKTIATLRSDGSPRISGIECEILDGDLRFGSMWRAVKALDLRRDPRFALHSGSIDPPAWEGDAKIAGRAIELSDEAKAAHREAREAAAPAGPWHLFSAEISEVVVVALDDARDKLVIESWHEGRGISSIER